MTIWWCEHCHASGLLRVGEREDVYTVVHLLEQAHDNHELAKHKACLFRTGRVRVELAQ
jgi:hypothetical protein